MDLKKESSLFVTNTHRNSVVFCFLCITISDTLGKNCKNQFEFVYTNHLIHFKAKIILYKCS